LAPKINETSEGQLCLDIIREFLEFYRMDYTLSTFLPECSLSNEPRSRPEIENKIGMPPADSSMPLLMHLILSFMKGVRTTLPGEEKEKPAPSPAKMEEAPVDPPLPGNLIPSDKKSEAEIEARSSVLTAEEEVKSTPVNPVAENKEEQKKTQEDALDKLSSLPPPKRGLSPLEPLGGGGGLEPLKKKGGLEPLKSPEPLTTEAEKKQVEEVDKALEQLGSA
jgi:hypothetical protein